MKKVSLLLVFVLAAIAVSAQDSGFSTKAGRNSTFARNGFWDNWFIGAGAGANVYFGDNNSDADFMNRITVAPTLQFGKWFNPYLGARVRLSGGSLHNFEDNATAMLHSKYVGGEVDFMWNVTNYLCKYNENRFYNFIAYAGMGAIYGWDYEVQGMDIHGKERSLTLNAGIINRFRLAKRLSLDIDISGAVVKEKLNKVGSKSYDGIANASASLVYKIGGKSDFSEALLMDQTTIDDLNGQVNRLRQENAKLSQRPEYCPECPKAETIVKEVNKGGTGSFVSNIVFFRLGSANVDKHQEVSIYNTAKYLEDNPNAKVRIVGYADKKTGTASINDKLSEKRAKNVANALINKYNINSNRVKVEWKGDTEQPYAENAWNRVAIFYAD